MFILFVIFVLFCMILVLSTDNEYAYTVETALNTTTDGESELEVNDLGNGVYWSYDAAHHMLYFYGDGKIPSYDYPQEAPWYTVAYENGGVSSYVIGVGITGFGKGDDGFLVPFGYYGGPQTWGGIKGFSDVVFYGGKGLSFGSRVKWFFWKLKFFLRKVWFWRFVLSY